MKTMPSTAVSERSCGFLVGYETAAQKRIEMPPIGNLMWMPERICVGITVAGILTLNNRLGVWRKQFRCQHPDAQEMLVKDTKDLFCDLLC